MTTINY